MLILTKFEVDMIIRYQYMFSLLIRYVTLLPWIWPLAIVDIVYAH